MKTQASIFSRGMQPRINNLANLQSYIQHEFEYVFIEAILELLPEILTFLVVVINKEKNLLVLLILLYIFIILLPIYIFSFFHFFP